ncbi:major facilitator superfamily domain-containing protein, partial [Zychaea mexicana]|uniref:major facilitator superfamily domain-containing protein n=1 Tax=Zychaea mexicana TaxID=64656 RepID=UPI0022FE3E20
EKPYSAFSTSYKRIIICILTINYIVHLMSYNIYFPAIDSIKNSFNTTVAMVNLTVTGYSVLNGIGPLVWGPFADVWGRRPIFLITFILYIASNVGLATVDSFVGFLILRMIQAFVSGPINALCAGVVTDIASPKERGGYFGVITGALMFSTVFSLFIGGAITYSLSWRWIFWFLAIGSSTACIITFALLPETLRAIVDDGSEYQDRTPLQLLYTKFNVCCQQTTAEDNGSSKKPYFFKGGFPNILKQLKLILEPDVALSALSSAMHYVIMSSVQTTASTIFPQQYGLNPLQVGLAFLVMGGGTAIGSVIEGRLLDRDYRIAKEKGLSIYRARLRSAWIQPVLLQLVVVLYGWCLYINAHLAVILVLHFIIGFVALSMYTVFQTLVVDLFPEKGSSVSGIMSFVRCDLAAAGVAATEPCLQALGFGWTFTVFAGLLATVNIYIFLLARYGPRWQAKRLDSIQ